MRAYADGIRQELAMLASVKSTTNVSLPSDLKAKAIEMSIPFSSTLTDALKKKIEDMEREGGKP